MKKTLLSMFMLVLAVTLVLSGCSGKNTESSNSAQGNGSSGGAESTKPVEISVFAVQESGIDIPTNKFTKFLEEKFNIKFNWQINPSDGAKEKRQISLASGDYPEAYLLTAYIDEFSQADVLKYGQQGVLIPLNDLIDKYAPNIKKAMEETPEMKALYTAPDGNIYGLGAYTECFHCSYPNKMWVNTEWLKKLNLEEPKTTEEFKAMLQAFKTQDPNGNGKADEVPLSGSIEDFGVRIVPYLMNAFVYDDDRNYLNLENGKVVSAAIKPEWREGLAYIKSLYDEGLIDPDFALSDDFSQAFAQQVVNSIAGAGTPNTNEPVYNGYYANLKANNPDAVLEAIDPFSTPDGKHPKPVYEPIGAYIMVPKTSKNAEAAVKYLNWMADPSNILVLQNGEEGVSYEMSEDGLPLLLNTPEAQNLLYNYYDYCIILNGKYISTEDPNKNIAANAFDPDFKDFTVKSIQVGTNDGYTLPRVDIAVDAEIKYAKILEDFEKEMLAKIVTAKPDQFDKVYDQKVEEYMAMGGKAVMEGKQAAYDEFYKK